MCWIESEIVVSIINTFVTTVYMTFYDLHVVAWGSAHLIEIRCRIKVSNIRQFCLAVTNFFELQ
jgi:hypothetical protein